MTIQILGMVNKRNSGTDPFMKWPGGVDLCPDAMYQANTLAQAGDRANSLHQQPGDCSRLTCRPVPCAAAG